MKESLAGLFRFIQSAPSPYHTALSAAAALERAGFVPLRDDRPWTLSPGGAYYTLRGGSALAAFRLPEQRPRAFAVIAPHGDSPCFRVKGKPELRAEGCTKLNVEVYGGTILDRWLDRPLSAAGMLMLRTENGARAVPVDLDRDLAVIPSLAIHMDRSANEGRKLDPQKELLPLLGGPEADLLALAAEAAGAKKEDVLSFDLRLYSRTAGFVYGAGEEFIAAPRLDDLECVYAALQAMLNTPCGETCPVFCLFDREEVGSSGRQGADSAFLSQVLERVWRGMGDSSCYNGGLDRDEYLHAVQNSLMLSADNAHAAHPNYPEKADPTNRCLLGGGVVVKNAVRYASDVFTAGLFTALCQRAGVPTQQYYNHSAIPGGGTLGLISGAQLPIPTVDIGLAQLAMHSPLETAGAEDLDHMIAAMSAFYRAAWTREEENLWTLR